MRVKAWQPTAQVEKVTTKRPSRGREQQVSATKSSKESSRLLLMFCKTQPQQQNQLQVTTAHGSICLYLRRSGVCME